MFKIDIRDDTDTPTLPLLIALLAVLLVGYWILTGAGPTKQAVEDSKVDSQLALRGSQAQPANWRGIEPGGGLKTRQLSWASVGSRGNNLKPSD